MSALGFPAVLALAGTLLLAFAVLAPARGAPRAPAGTVSYAPPAPLAVERWTPPEPDETPLWAAPAPEEPSWTAALDPRAAGADAPTRLRLIDALATVDGAWALALLERARDQEREPAVQAAVHAALSGRTGR